jgi:hypothetical protein
MLKAAVRGSRFIDRFVEVWLILTDPSERQERTLWTRRRKSNEDQRAIMPTNAKAFSGKVALVPGTGLTIDGGFTT